VTISKETRKRIREQASNRCGYCLSQQRYVLGPLEIEHIIPIAKKGTDDEENLWLACRLCNSYKGQQTEANDPLTGQLVPLFNPRTQTWTEHFRWSSDGVRIIGLTPIGRVTVGALKLNHATATTVREGWVGAKWHPP
jgi:hypothetical protein